MCQRWCSTGVLRTCFNFKQGPASVCRSCADVGGIRAYYGHQLDASKGQPVFVVIVTTLAEYWHLLFLKQCFALSLCQRRVVCD